MEVLLSSWTSPLIFPITRLVKTQHKPIISLEQQALLDGVALRLISSEERQRFDEQMVRGHYLHNVQIVGEQFGYVAEYQGQWVALMIWSAGAYKLKLREEWIGWSDRQKKRRLALVVNNSRFFIPEPYHIPNLASKVMKLVLRRLSEDWQQAYGHGVLYHFQHVTGLLLAAVAFT